MIGIVVINYKNHQETISFIKSLCDLDIDEKSFCVVDNSFDSDEFDKLKDNLVNILNLSLIDAKSNLGYAKANNLGANYLIEKYSELEYMIFSNTDISFPEKDVVRYLKNKMDINISIACCNPKIIDSNEVFYQTPFKLIPFNYKFSLKYFFFPLNFILRKPFFWDDLVHNAIENNYHRLSGAFLMVRKSSFLEVEGFDNFTFLYAEESILSDRFRSKGLLSMYFPDRKIYHEVSKTISKYFDSKNKAKLMLDSNIYYHKKYRNLDSLSPFIARIGYFVYFYIYKNLKLWK